MIPFHKIYSTIFKSFNINSETETIERLNDEWIKKIMVIKRSWIFWLAMIWVPLLILILSFTNIYISYFSYKDLNLKYSLLIWVAFSLLLFIFSVWSYLAHFRQVYDAPRIETDTQKLIASLKEWDNYFIRFFNQTILNQWIIIWLLIWSIVFYITHLKINWGIWIISDGVLLFIQWLLLGKYRKKMMDLEMDYNIVVPGKIIFVNQSGMLSSSQAVEGEKVKTVTAKYPSFIWSFFQYGTIEIMTEWWDLNQGVTSMYYVPQPTETARLIQTLLSKETTNSDTQHSKKIEKGPNERSSSINIGSDEVGYDIRSTVRDVLR